MTGSDGIGSAAGTVAKTPTGIEGLDAITGGGVPTGRPTLLCGGPGCGKTVLGMEFLVQGARDGEPGLFVTFEERPEDLIQNFASMTFGLPDLIARGLVRILHIHISRDEIVESGQFTLDALRIRIQHAAGEIGAKRLVVDAMDSVFSALSPSEMLRFEVARLLEWLKDAGLTTMITSERGSGELTRNGFEAYISDCVILLDQRITEQLSTRRLRIVKFRGSRHDRDEFPFLIDHRGVSVLPITSLSLIHEASLEKVSSGVPDLDAALGDGYYRGTSVLITGKAGTGKSSLATRFAEAAVERGERCLYFALEESPSQLLRNMRSIGIDLAPGLESGLLQIVAFRPTFRGIEEHLLGLTRAVDEHVPSCVVLDPITNFISVGDIAQVKSMLARILHHLKSHGMTLVLTALTTGSAVGEETETTVSSLIDTWVDLELARYGATRRRELHIVKSRGMDHSHDDFALLLSRQGISLRSLEGRSS
jgi:circadian clock protein KaiC